MKRMTIAIVAVLLMLPRLHAAKTQIKPDDLLAICGDSITEQKQYSVFIEDYLLMCRPDLNARTMQFGWGGEVSWGFLPRMDNDVLRYKPTIATTCYGMNDGGYAALSDERAKHYRQAMTDVVKKFKDAGARVVVGSPGCVDSTTFKFGVSPDDYNKTLASLRDVARQVAEENGCGFADVHQIMFDTMAKAKAKYGDKYPIAGNDGIHPGANGHLVMAYAFLKALGCDGDIGTITVDLGSNKATATQGHVVKSVESGAVTIESSRYPFCFFGDDKSPDATTGIIQFFPFNDDLNRFKLIVSGGNADRYKITWGETSKEFSAAALSKGVNLAAEFIANPFCKPFRDGEKSIRDQQNFETLMIKQLVHSLAQYKEMLPEDKSQFDQICDDAGKKDAKLMSSAREAVKPVTHIIKIEAAK